MDNESNCNDNLTFDNLFFTRLKLVDLEPATVELHFASASDPLEQSNACKIRRINKMNYTVFHD